MQVGGLSSTIRSALLNLLHVNQLQNILFYYLFSAVCILICLCLFKGWEQAHQRKEESTLQILRNTGNILFGKMNRMGEAIELAFSKKKIEERKSWLRQFEVKVLPCFLLVFLEKVNEYISNITPSEWQPGTHLDQTGKLINTVTLSTRSLYCFQWQIFRGLFPSWLMA